MSVPSLQVFFDGPIAVDADALNTFLQGGQIASQLRAISGITGMSALLQGISVPGDGLGGFFYWNAAATADDDDLNVLVPNGSVPGAWLRLPTPSSISVTSFNGRIGVVTLVSGDVTTALGFTPYSAANPLLYQTQAQVAAAVQTETARATAAEALLAPKASPTLTGQIRMGTVNNLNPATALVSVENASGIALQVMNAANSPAQTSMIVRNDRTDGTAIAFNFGNSAVGSITQNGTTTTYNTTSDYRLKLVYGPAWAVSLIDAIPVYSAAFKQTPDDVRPMFLAHEVQAHAPYAVSGEKDATDPETGEIVAQMIDHSILVPALWSEVQSLRRRIAELEGK